jgi:hypothetical protein
VQESHRIRSMYSLVWLVATLLAAASQPAMPAIDELQPIVISARPAGPALWKVSSGDHVLWVLGTLSVAPKHFKWRSDDIERVLASSQALLGSPGIMPDANLGVFSMMRLLPMVIHMGNLPDNGTLQTTLPAPLYARWVTLRQRYLDDSRRFERLRPFLAAEKLKSKAYAQAGLVEEDDEIETAVKKLAKKHRVPEIDTEYHLFIKDPKALIRDFKAVSMDDSACFSYELDVLERTLLTASSQSEAWATGDVAGLKKSAVDEGADPCWQGLDDSPLERDLGVQDLEANVNNAWLAAAEKALADHQQSVALLEMSDVVEPKGLLSMLEARGYTVQAPREK